MKYTKLYTLLSLLITCFVQQSSAQSYLVTHRFIQQKVAAGYFQQKPSTTIPADDISISATEAKSWLSLDETRLPVDGRLPWWSELQPKTIVLTCTGTSYAIYAVSNPVYSSCGSYLYSPGYDVNFDAFTRRRMGPTNAFWVGTPEDQQANCNLTVPTTRTKTTGALMINNMMATNVADTARGSMLKTNGATQLAALPAAGPMNRCGIWGSGTPVANWLSVSGIISLSSARTCYIGAGADNFFRIFIDDKLVVFYNKYDQEAFRVWHVLPVDLTAGSHTIRFEGKDDGNTGSMGCEFYDNTIAEMESAGDYDHLKVLFTTRGLTGSVLCLSGPN